MADVDVSLLNKGISDLNKNLSRLLGANLFSNSRMNDMVEASNKMRDNFEDISEFTNDLVKRAKEEETKLKAVNALERKRLEIRKLERDIEDKTNKIQKNELDLAKRSEKITQRFKKNERDRIEALKKQILLYADQRKELQLQLSEAQANLKTVEEQTKEFEKQLAIQKKQRSLFSSLGSDFKRLGGNLKNLASGTIGKFLSAGMFAEGVKNLYDMSNKVYDSYWKLSVPLQKANTGMGALKDKTEEYSKALRGVKLTAAKFGYDIDKIEPMISSLQDKVKYLRKDSEGLWEWDIQGLAGDAKQIIAISKKMNMESDEMVTLLEERVRRFGDTNKSALNSMNEMAAATLTFNEIMGQGSVFTEEVGKHLLELHQNTKYWVQDFGMLNTMFNSHVNLLLKQGKHQKEALAIARQFQEGLQQPPDLIKWKAGTKMLTDIKSKIKNLSDEKAEEKIKELYGENVDAATIVKAIRHGGNTAFTTANILQEMLGGTVKGTEATMGAWKSFMNYDSSVLKDMGLASTVSDAEKIKQLYKDLSRLNLNASTSMEDAINKMVDIDKNLSDEEKKARKEELKGLLNANKGMAGVEPESSFENVVLKTMKSLKAWLDTPMVQIAGGAFAGGASIFKNTLSTILGNLASAFLMSKGGAVFKAGKAFVGKTVSNIGSTISSAKASSLRYSRLQALKAGDTKILSGISKSSGNLIRPLKSTMSASQLKASSRLLRTEQQLLTPAMQRASKFSKIGKLAKGGLLAAGVGILSSKIGNGSNKWDEESVAKREQERNAVVEQGLSSIELVRRGYAKNIEEAISLQNKFAKNGSASWSQVGKSFASMTGEIAGLIPQAAPFTLAFGGISGAIKSAKNDANIATGAIVGMFDVFYGAAESVEGFLADLTDDDDLKRASKSISNFRKELGYLTRSIQIEKAGITAEGQERLKRTANDLYVNRALSKSTILTSAENLEYAKSFDWGSSLTSTRQVAKSGWFGNKTQEEYLKEKGLIGGNVNKKEQAKNILLYETAREVATARMQSSESEYSAEDIEAETQAIMDEQLERQKQQLEAEKTAAEEAKRAAGGINTLIQDSKKQMDYLSIISQKAAMDILKDKDTYTKIFDEHYKTGADGKVTANGDKWTVSGIPTAMAGSMKAVFSL